MQDASRADRTDDRLADRALALTVTVLLLLTPPVVTIFSSARVFGIPLLPAYCFAVWLVAIALGAMLARRMVTGEADSRGPGHVGR